MKEFAEAIIRSAAGSAVQEEPEDRRPIISRPSASRVGWVKTPAAALQGPASMPRTEKVGIKYRKPSSSRSAITAPGWTACGRSRPRPAPAPLPVPSRNGFRPFRAGTAYSAFGSTARPRLQTSQIANIGAPGGGSKVQAPHLCRPASPAFAGFFCWPREFSGPFPRLETRNLNSS